MAEIRPTRQQTKSGKTYFIRHAQGKDAPGVLEAAREVIAESVYSLTSAEEFLIPLEDEIAFLEAFRKDPRRLFLIAELEKRVVGTLDFTPGHWLRIAHTGEFGMGVVREFRSEGIGNALLQALIDWARATGSIEKINLQVHADNARAIALYKKLGFEMEGVRKRELKYDESRYVDSVLMARFLQESRSNWSP